MPTLKDELAALKIERPPERRSRPWVKWVVVLAVLGVGGAFAWQSASRPRPVEVETAAVVLRAAGVQASVLNATGYVTARRRATVSSKITGKVLQVSVEEGMRVSAGQVLARLDDAQFRASLALAEAQAEAARRNVRESEVRLAEARLSLERAQRLAADRLNTAADLDSAKATVDSLLARIDAAREQVRVAERQIDVERANLDNTIIRAPFAGVAVSKDAQPGEMVSPNSAGGGFTRTGIGTIVDMDSLEIEIDVNESFINRVEPGQAVEATLDAYAGWKIPCKVIAIIPTADRQKATVKVRVGFDKLDPRILPEMAVKVAFYETGASAAVRAVTVPKRALKSQDGRDVVFVVRNGHAERRAVTISSVQNDEATLSAGVASGDAVVLDAPGELLDGMKVREAKP